MMEEDHLIIGIDVGKGGGISTFHPNHFAKAFDMPKSAHQLHRFLKEISADKKAIAFVEKVGKWHSDSGDGKQFGIDKMLANYESIKTCLEILEIPYVLVPAVTWQTRMNLKSRKGESKPERKKRYKEVAVAYIPYLKPTLKTADAICIMIFGKKMIKQDPNWIRERLMTFENSLF